MRRTTPFLFLLALITLSMACRGYEDADANSLGGGKSNSGDSSVPQEPPISDDFNNADSVVRPARPTGLPVFDPDADAPRTRPIGSEDLILIEGGDVAVASDASTDSLYFVDLGEARFMHPVRFARGSWPGRLAPSRNGVYVILQGTGEVAHVDLDGTIDMRQRVCPAPRGITVDNTHQKVWVACASSELISLEPETLAKQETFFIDADLRDVIATDRDVFVSRFRAAEILRINPGNGNIKWRRKAPVVSPASDPPEDSIAPMTNSLWRITKGKEDTIHLA